MFKLFVFCVFATSALAYNWDKIEEKTTERNEELVPPKPYAFSYDIVDDEGNKNGRQETGDDQGNKKGSYSIELVNGLRRWLEYVADENGFRVIVRTNEPGIGNKNPADVEMEVEESPLVKEEPKLEAPAVKEVSKKIATKKPKVVNDKAPQRYKIIKIPIYEVQDY